jgi:hypothetical protein
MSHHSAILSISLMESGVIGLLKRVIYEPFRMLVDNKWLKSLELYLQEIVHSIGIKESSTMMNTMDSSESASMIDLLNYRESSALTIMNFLMLSFTMQ